MNTPSPQLTFLFKFLFLITIPVFISSCSNKEKKTEQEAEEKEYLFTQMKSGETGINFINDVKNGKDFNIFKYRNFYNGAGVGIGDINNDGLPDVYLTSNMGENKLYLNQGDFKFKDITASSGTAGNRSWSTGVTMVDINNDGLLDIYVSNAGNMEGDDRRNELFLNNGDLTFTEAAASYKLDENGFTTHAAFFDYDGDGDLDVYILNNSFIPVSSLGYTNKRDLRSDDWNLPEVFKGGGDKLLRNNNGIFEDVSEEAGIYGSLIGFGLGVTIGDVNNDYLPDIYVSNDFYERDYLYINQGDGTFKEQIKDYISHLSLSSMGADMADINNDGFPEIFVTDMLPEDDERLKNTSEFERYDLYKRKLDSDFYHQYMQNTLQLNNTNNTFSEIAFYSGVAETDWSWGALIFDMNNNGFKDIFVSNGILHDLTNQDFMDFFANEILQKMVLTGKKKEFDSILNQMPSTPIPNYAFKNNGDLTFDKVAEEWGFSTPGFSNGSAYGDLDGDGDLDLIVNNVNMELFVYRNNSERMTENNFLKVNLKGTGKNTFAIGSRVNLYVDGKVIYQELIPTRGFQSSIDYALTFGLGNAKKIDSLQVIWPNRQTEVVYGHDVNKVLMLDQKNAGFNTLKNIPPPTPLFSLQDHQLRAHKEDNYIDFDYEGLIHQMLSREGPAVAVGDITGDGNDDIFLGGARNQGGTLYVQRSSGKFTEVKNDSFFADAEFEDTDAIFADVTGNGKKDLIVVSGGNIGYAEGSLYQTRLYENQGNGKFVRSKKIIPSTKNNAAVIVAHDYDGDGDIDLFIGSRSVPGTYGIDPLHQLLENDGSGNFKDVTEAKAFELKGMGMITSATWEDMDSDGNKDLVVAGEWMAPKIFKNTPQGLLPWNTNLDELTGAWTAVAAVDINGNGHMDLILGNRGTNSFYNISGDGPVKMYINDFDNNGTIEQIFTRPIKGKDVPVHLRRELSGQIASLKKQNLKFSEYARRSIDDLFSKEIIESSIVKNISTFKSIIAINNGDGTFALEELPAQVQLSSIHAIQVLEREGGAKEIILAGNNHNLKPQFTRLDANQGIILTRNKNGAYKVKSPQETGLLLNGQVRALHLLSAGNRQKLLLAGMNNESPEIYKLN
ncbi:CRTAC1 family protein [Antarcticibacterium arcticum]|uniref:CRTAC1 family protein n=1 Tax=Antarcticibacterium arcticum TaxID=2585771 RepID=A0A5B8YHK4_9FLAO|nr:VCBS repeat-containing protein [Antarcticibacterium arcticum]QED37284.1 CRTAC1 family protein [Antarcticibacterium arcticum]